MAKQLTPAEVEAIKAVKEKQVKSNQLVKK